MDKYKLFTLDPIAYPPTEVKNFVNELHKNHQHYVIIGNIFFKI